MSLRLAFLLGLLFGLIYIYSIFSILGMHP